MSAPIGTPDSERPDPLGVRRCASCGNAFEIEIKPDGKTCGHCGGLFYGPPPADELASERGLFALVINPSGSTHLKRLPVNWIQAARLIAELLGSADPTAIGGPPPNGDHLSLPWCAYVDGNGIMMRKAPNPKADTIARQLGWNGRPDDHLLGTVVFLGRDGTIEADVPTYVRALAGSPMPGDADQPRSAPRMMP